MRAADAGRMNRVRQLSPVRRALLAAAGLTLALVPLVAACGNSPSDGAIRLALVAYSTPREAYAQLIKAFQATPDGANVAFDESYGGSTEQSLAVRNGLPADVVALSLEPDVTSLVDAGIVAPDWDSDPQRGMITDSVAVLVVRKGNPKALRDWSDLVKPGVEVVTPNPFTSGGAQWNITAAYGAELQASGSPEKATSYLRDLFAHVPVQGKSAREAMQAFVGGKGDALISYEDEAITAQQAGEQVDYVIPNQTILIETPLAVTTTSSHPRQARAFVAFLHTPTAQRIFAEAGYRPLEPSVAQEFNYPQPAGLFTIDDLGGWPAVQSSLFDRQTGLVADVFAAQGIAQDGN
jgi:sulfate transport system substrate-binding protein